MEGQTVTTVMILSFRTEVWANSADPDQTADQHLDFAIPSASFEHITLW